MSASAFTEMPNTNVVIGQGWIALKPEYCIRERQLVRSQNRLSYERGWAGRGGGERECKHEARARGARGGGWRGMIARNSSPGRCGAEGIIQTLPSLSPLPHLSKRVCESPRARHAGPLRGQRKTPRLRSPSRREWAHHCWQTSGLTLITYVCRRGGGAGRFVLWATEILHIPFYHLIHASSLCCFSPLLHHVSLAFYTPPLIVYSHPWHWTGKRSRTTVRALVVWQHPCTEKISHKR